MLRVVRRRHGALRPSRERSRGDQPAPAARSAGRRAVPIRRIAAACGHCAEPSAATARARCGSTGRRCCAGCATRRSTCSSIGGGITGVGVGARRRVTRAAHRAGRARRLRLRHVVEELEARPRRVALPPAGRGAARVRGAARAPAAAPERTAPRARAAVHDPDPRQGRSRRGAQRRVAPDRSRARVGDVDVRPHRRVADRQGAPPPAPRHGLRAPADDGARIGCVGAYLYYDAQADDARLVVSIARTAAAHGAAVANRCPVVDDRRTTAAGRADGAVVEADGERIRVRARAVVNATGVWADDVRGLDEGAQPRLAPAGQGRARDGPVGQGAQRHRRRDPGAEGQAQPVPRAVGPPRTTARSSTPTSAPPTPTTTGSLDDPQCTREDIDYVLRALNASVTTGITADDVTGTWAGLRPLVRTSADLRWRRAAPPTCRAATASPTSASGVDHRHRRQADDLPRDGRGHDRRRGRRSSAARARCRTKRLPLLGAPGTARRASARATRHLARPLRHRGRRRRGAHRRPTRPCGEPLVPGLPYLRAEAIHAVRAEMATTLDDVLSRRTRARLLDRGRRRSPLRRRSLR